MNGIEGVGNRHSPATNFTTYYNKSQKLAYGVEYNYSKTGIRTRILPQVKYHFENDYEIQIGVGVQGKKPLFAMRLIHVI